jgi:hypothetical protein
MLSAKDANRELTSARRYFAKCQKVVQKLKDDNESHALISHWEEATKKAETGITEAQALVERVS